VHPARERDALETLTWPEEARVVDHMTRGVATIHSDALARGAAQMMRTRRIRHLPVVDRGGRLVGIVTDRDLRQVVFDAAIRDWIGAEADALADLPVREVMTWAVVTVSADTDVRATASVMRERRVGALPVVDATGRVVGILTERDLLRVLDEMLAQRVVRPRPAVVEPGGAYDPSVTVAPDDDPWRDLFALD
jgi:acetoin utilization protein AcuB